MYLKENSYYLNSDLCIIFIFLLILGLCGSHDNLIFLEGEALYLLQGGCVLELLCQVVQECGDRVNGQHMHGVYNQVVSESDETVKRIIQVFG